MGQLSLVQINGANNGSQTPRPFTQLCIWRRWR